MKRGFTLVEMVIYVGLVVLLIAVAVEVFLVLGRSSRALAANQAVANASLVALERLVRETRGAASVDSGQSTLGASPGRLTLNTPDENGLLTTLEFYLDGQVLHLREGGVERGSLTPTTVRVTSLIYRLLDSGRSQAVRVELQLESGAGETLVSKNFFTTVVLRGSYPSS